MHCAPPTTTTTDFTLHHLKTPMQSAADIADDIEDDFPMILPKTPMTMPTLEKTEMPAKPMLATTSPFHNLPPLTPFAADVANDVEDDFPMIMPTMQLMTMTLTEKTEMTEKPRIYGHPPIPSAFTFCNISPLKKSAADVAEDDFTMIMLTTELKTMAMTEKTERKEKPTCISSQPNAMTFTLNNPLPLTQFADEIRRSRAPSEPLALDPPHNPYTHNPSEDDHALVHKTPAKAKWLPATPPSFPPLLIPASTH